MSENSATLILGVDGGGSGCRAAIARAPSEIVARAEGGSANITTDFELAITNVRRAMELAAAEAGITPSDLARMRAHVGLAGVTTDALARRTEAALGLPLCRVSDDRATAVEGALGGRDGAVLAVGTGTIVALRRAGALTFVGGYGLNLSDQASGGWIGRRALTDALLAHDGLIKHSDLTRELLTRLDGPVGLIAFAAGARPSDYAALAPEIVTAGARFDPVATAILSDGAAYLEAGLKCLGVRDDDALCLAGGIGPHYRSYLTEALSQRITPPVGSALDGALRLAARAAVR